MRERHRESLVQWCPRPLGFNPGSLLTALVCRQSLKVAFQGGVQGDFELLPVFLGSRINLQFARSTLSQFNMVASDSLRPVCYHDPQGRVKLHGAVGQ